MAQLVRRYPHVVMALIVAAILAATRLLTVTILDLAGVAGGIAFLAALLASSFWFDRRPLSPEDKIDIGASVIFLLALFGGLLALPRSVLLYWLVPLMALWVRFNWVMMKRELH